LLIWLPKRLWLLLNWGYLLSWTCWLLDRKWWTDRLSRLLKRGWLPEWLGESWLLLAEWLLGDLLL
jgi:hypothetical protein